MLHTHPAQRFAQERPIVPTTDRPLNHVVRRLTPVRHEQAVAPLADQLLDLVSEIADDLLTFGQADAAQVDRAMALVGRLNPYDDEPGHVRRLRAMIARALR